MTTIVLPDSVIAGWGSTWNVDSGTWGAESPAARGVYAENTDATGVTSPAGLSFVSIAPAQADYPYFVVPVDGVIPASSMMISLFPAFSMLRRPDDPSYQYNATEYYAMTAQFGPVSLGAVSHRMYGVNAFTGYNLQDAAGAFDVLIDGANAGHRETSFTTPQPIAAIDNLYQFAVSVNEAGDLRASVTAPGLVDYADPGLRVVVNVPAAGLTAAPGSALPVSFALQYYVDQPLRPRSGMTNPIARVRADLRWPEPAAPPTPGKVRGLTLDLCGRSGCA